MLNPEANPLTIADGYHELESLNSEKGFPKHEIHGCMFFWLRDMLRTMSRRCQQQPVHLEFTNRSPLDLPQYLHSRGYDIIDITSLIEPKAYPEIGSTGYRKALALYAPLLKAASVSPNACIVGLFSSAVESMRASHEEAFDDYQSAKQVDSRDLRNAAACLILNGPLYKEPPMQKGMLGKRIYGSVSVNSRSNMKEILELAHHIVERSAAQDKYFWKMFSGLSHMEEASAALGFQMHTFGQAKLTEEGEEIKNPKQWPFWFDSQNKIMHLREFWLRFCNTMKGQERLVTWIREDVTFHEGLMEDLQGKGMGNFVSSIAEGFGSDTTLDDSDA